MQPTDFAVLTYASYLALSVGLTVWVARTLVKNGRIFLVDAPGAPQRAPRAAHGRAHRVNAVITKLYVLYDADCGICTRCARWLAAQRRHVRMECLPQRLALPRRAVPHAPRPTPATPPP